MKLIRPRTFVIFALAALSGAVLLHTSQSVQKSEERLEMLELAKYRDQEKIRMLRAEWETLNRPERLEKLANEFLEMVPPSPDQMAKTPDPLPVYQPEDALAPQGDADLAPESQAPKLYEAAAPLPAKKPAPKAVSRNLPTASQVLKNKEDAKSFDDLIGELGDDGENGGGVQ